MERLADGIALLAIAWYGVLSVVTFAVYWADKRAAIKSNWRTKERTLHLLDGVGGWPGGILAQQILRHKRRKASFFLITWGTALVHLVVWGFIISR